MGWSIPSLVEWVAVFWSGVEWGVGWSMPSLAEWAAVLWSGVEWGVRWSMPSLVGGAYGSHLHHSGPGLAPQWLSQVLIRPGTPECMALLQFHGLESAAEVARNARSVNWWREAGRSSAVGHAAKKIWWETAVVVWAAGDFHQRPHIHLME